MKKTLKSIVKALFGLVLFLLVLVLALPLWIGPVVTMVANKTVPGKIGTEFNLSEFGLNPYSGRLHAGGLTIANPEGFSKGNCIDLTDFDVNVAMSSLFADTILVKEVAIRSLVVSTDMKGRNFKKIAENASAEDKAGAEKTAEEPAKTAQGDQKGGPKVIIEKLILKDLTVKLNKVPIVIPDLEITDIGKGSESGVSFTEAWETVVMKILSSTGALAGALGDLGKGTVYLGKGTLSVGADVGGAAINLGADTVGAAAGAAKDIGSAAKDAGKAIKHMFKKNKNK